MQPDSQDPGRLYEGRLKHVSMQSKERTLAEFVREQRKHLEYYAKEGKRVMGSIDASRSELSHAAKVKEPRIGDPPKETNAFDLPTLKPRRIQPLANQKEEVIAQSKPKVDRRREESDEENEEIAKQPSRPVHDKKAIQRREGLSDAEIQRLDDRRERKKNRREIMKPKGVVEEAPKAKSKKSKKGASKGPFDTAFMHGLVSTNVGKKRLTLQPFQTNMGVFNKGKTSTKIDIQAAKEKKQHNTIEQLVESKDAKSKRHSHKFEAKAVEEHVDITSSESQTGTSTVNSPPIKRARRRSPELPPVSAAGKSDKLKSNSTSNRKPYDPADSVVWDIEASSITLGSQVEEALVNRSCDGGTKPNVNLQTIAQKSDVSLAPSQSASQPKRTPPEESTRGSPVADQVSRYFSRPTNIANVPKNNMTVREASPIGDFMTFNWKQTEKDPKSDSGLEYIPNSPPKVRSSHFPEVAQEVPRPLVEKRPAIMPEDDDASSLYYQEEGELLHPLSDWSFYPAQESECDADLESHMDEANAEVSERVQESQIVHWDKTNDVAVLYDDMQYDDWTEAQTDVIWEPIEAFHDHGPESDDDATMGAIMEDIWSSYLPEPLYPEYGGGVGGRFEDETEGLEGNTELSVCQSEDHQRFYQGKFLLDRVHQEDSFGIQNAVIEAEQEVADRLGQGYWFPQKMY